MPALTRSFTAWNAFEPGVKMQFSRYAPPLDSDVLVIDKLVHELMAPTATPVSQRCGDPLPPVINARLLIW